MDICLRGGRVIDPARGMDATADVLVKGGVISKVGAGLAGGAGVRDIDVSGRWVVPGLIDLHTHLREPGQEYKEDIVTGTRAAAAGGFTAVCAMPNTTPVNDNRAVTELIVRRAAEVGIVRVYPVGAISKGSKGESLSEMGELREAGCVAVSDDGHPVMNAELMRRAMEYARTFGLPIVQHCEDLTLSAGGAMNEGIVSTRAGIRAQPSAAESSMVARDIEICALTGARYHVAHISSAESVRLVREAKRRGLPVTCEVTPHHLTLTDEACASYDTHAKCNPPLRAAEDVEAVCAGLVDGTIDAVATDHAPHSTVEKDVEFEQAAFGVIGLETAVPLVLALVHAGRLSPMDFVRRMSAGPAAAFGLRGGSLGEGRLADVTVIDPDMTWTCKPGRLRSRSHNTPFAGLSLKGRATLTIVGGRIVYSGENLA
ncbi:MAG: dihydroorotase, multifunctional complex type [Myxococcales bacterium]|nr:dihydroorotase, multifunctional complex type [Myxococcales bacterium]